MSSLINSWSLGLVWALLALGVFLTFRIFSFPDVTADGSITLGASVAAVLLTAGTNPFLATAAAFGAGLVAGTLTGILHVQFKIDGLLSGFLVMTSLFSVNLRILGKSNLSIPEGRQLASYAERWLGKGTVPFWEWQVNVADLIVLLAAAAVVTFVGCLLYAFLRTDIGTAMRATGDNAQMIRALGVNSGLMIVFGVALSNGLVAVSGAVVAQYQGFADVQMGIGMVLQGLASVIIGEALVGTRHLGLTITSAVLGSLTYQLMRALVLRAGLNANDLKLITACFVFVAMVLPGFLGRLRRQRVKHA